MPPKENVENSLMSLISKISILRILKNNVFLYFCDMQVTVEQIAQLVGGKIEGNSQALINEPSKIEEGKVGSISFLTNLRYEKYIYDTKASAVIVNNDFIPQKEVHTTLIRVENAHFAISQLMQQFGDSLKEIPKDNIDKLTSIHESVTIGKQVTIKAFTSIDEGVEIGDNTIIHEQVHIAKHVKIGKNCILYPGVRIYHSCEIQDNVVVHSNTVVGADGFGFAADSEGKYAKIPQLGNVILETNVEIGSNTTIDRAMMGSTIIKAGAKIDNLVQIAHNVVVGENTVIAAQAGIAGSTKIGKNCQIGGQVGIVGHIQIADYTKIQAQSGVNKAIKHENEAFYGSPALKYNDYLKSYAVFKNLPQLGKQLKKIEDSLRQLKDIEGQSK